MKHLLLDKARKDSRGFASRKRCVRDRGVRQPNLEACTRCQQSVIVLMSCMQYETYRAPRARDSSTSHQQVRQMNKCSCQDYPRANSRKRKKSLDVGPPTTHRADTQVSTLQVLCTIDVEALVNDTTLLSRFHGTRAQTVPCRLDVVCKSHWESA